MRRRILPAAAVVLGVSACGAWWLGWSTLTLVCALAGWAAGGTWAASQWVGIVPPPVDELPPDERWPAVRAFQGLQAAANVARWRRVVVAAGMVAIVLVWNQADDQRVRCGLRDDSRTDTRALGVGMVDEVADFAGLTIAERDRLEQRAAARALRELPPPDC